MGWLVKPIGIAGLEGRKYNSAWMVCFLLRRLEIKPCILRRTSITLDELYTLFFGDLVERRLGVVSILLPFYILSSERRENGVVLRTW